MVAAVLLVLVAAPGRSHAATCFCRVTANGQEVAKPSKGGYLQATQGEACRNYCRGVWDSKSGADLLAWAKLSGKCGDIDLRMSAAIGTAAYKEVRRTTVANPCPPPPPASCNLLQNGDFSAGLNVTGDGSMPGSTVANWAAAFNTPQLSAQPGCFGNAGFVRMWGNQTVGEGIRQTLSAPLTPGHTYRLTGCVAWLNNNPALPQYVRFKVRLSNGALGSYTAPGTLMGVFGQPTNSPPIQAPGITSQQWSSVALANWTAPANTSLNTLTITPENNNTANDGGTVSWGQIDNLCLEDLSKPCSALDPDFTLTAVLSAGSAPTYKLTATTAALPAGAGFAWQVEEIDLATGNVVPNTTVQNPSAWWANPTTNVFAGYNGTSTLGNTANPGAFLQGHAYRITRGVWDPCRPWKAVSHTVYMRTP